MKRFLTALSCLLPSKIAILCLKILGHKVNWNSYIGFSFVLVDRLILAQKTRIGHLNFIKVDKITLKEKAFIGNLNIIRGPIVLDFNKNAAVGNSNIISRANIGVTYGEGILKLGELTKITARHSIDLTRNITIGDFSTIAGAASQIWTHGYIHDNEGPGRIRVDGEVLIKNNVYIGSNCIVNAGIEIHSGITVGSNSTISKSLIEPGMYVGQKLRYIDKDIDDVKQSLNKIDAPNLVEDVYQK
ncbi:MAG: hypothetical protein AAFX55_13210 [Bacteroidota bacterium]